MNKTVNRNGKKLMMFSFSLKNEVKIGVIYPSKDKQLSEKHYQIIIVYYIELKIYNLYFI